MGEIIRYDVYGPDNLGISADGDLVRFEDYDALREQNRVLREALQEIYEGRWTPGVSCCYEDDARDIYPTREMRIRNIAMAALTATSREGQG